MAIQDELSVSPAELQNLGQQAAQESAEVEAIVEDSEDAGNLDSDIEVESGFWEDEESETEESPIEDTSEEADEEKPKAGQPKVVTYKANGQEVSITLDEAGIAELQKKLPLVDGARKAFSDKARIEKELKTQADRVKELEEYKNGWDKLEAVRNDRKKLWKLITGEDYDTALNREIERRSTYENATEAERRLMDIEAEREAEKAELQRLKSERESQTKTAEEKLYEAEKTDFKTKLESEFSKYSAPVEGDPAVANRIKKMLWTSAVADLKAYNKKYGKVTQRMIEKAFGDNAAALQAAYNTTVEKRVQEASGKRQVEAKSKAQEAATKNYATKVEDSWKKLDPMSLFRKMKSSK
jgi:hypothetical protein